MTEQEARDFIASKIFKQMVGKKSGRHFEVVNKFIGGPDRIIGPIATEEEADELRDTMRGQKLYESMVI